MLQKEITRNIHALLFALALPLCAALLTFQDAAAQNADICASA